MKAKTSWNTQPKTDTVAFSALIAAAMLLTWFGAAVPFAGNNAAPAITQSVVQPADQASDSRIVVTARRLPKNQS